jgi:catechol 2,3-dioxygenase-like lactoylglutathione lyase family enzyme
MINGVHHIALAVRDLDAMVAFYTEHLGFEVVMETSWTNRSDIDAIVGLTNSAARQAMLRAGTTHVEVFEYSAPPPASGDPGRRVCDPGYTHFCLDVTDIDSEYARLTEAGMTFHSPPAPASELGSGKIRAVYGRDPEGNVIELQEILDPTLAIALENLT